MRRVRKTLSNLASRVIGILTLAAAVGWLPPTAAYGQTAEGTVINNIATVTFTDANSNTYSSVNGNVTVTVGHSAGIDVVAAQATATPVSPSTGNTMDFYVINIGNGTDSVSVAETNSDATVLTVTNYRFNATDYANIGLLNTALAAAALAATDTAAIEVTYDIAFDKGGEPSTYTLTGTSRRDGTATDNDNTVVTPGLTGTVAVTPDGAQSLTHLPSNGTNYTFTFTVQNNQTGPDDFDLLVTSPGSAVISIVSVNGFAGDSTRVNIAASASPTFDVIYSVADVTAGTPDTLYLEARSVANGAITDQGFADMTVINTNVPTLVLRKTVDAASAVAGDILTYTITYEASALGSNDLTIRDTIPAGLSYEAGTLRLGTRALTDVSGDDEGYHDQTAGVIVVTVPAADVQPEDSVSFQVRVLPLRTTAMLQNVAVASAGATVGASNVSETLIAGPDLLLEKTVQGPNPARSGDELVYRILLTNDNNAGLAQDAVVTDTLPWGLEIVDAGPGATVDGNVVTWAFGDVNSSDQVEALLQVRVMAAIPDTLVVTNVANLSLSGEPHMTASAPSVLLWGTPGDILALDLQGETLEAQLGEPVYLSFTVENRSDMTISVLGVRIDVPSGLAWAESPEAADSTQVQPGQVTLYLGSLAPGATLEGRVAFALVSALPGNMVISAMAFGHVDGAPVSGPAPLVAALRSGAAPAGAPAALTHGAAPTDFDVRSAVEQIFVGVRAGTPLETRTVIGKVWIDEDGNGRQDNGERGVLGVSVWNEAGDVSSSDSEGKLSFRNVRPGSHTFRVDRSTLPLALRVNPEGDDGFASLHLNGWASGRISFGLIPRSARLVDFQIWTEDEAAGGELPVLRLANRQVETEDAATGAALSTLERPAASDAAVRSVLVLEPHRAGWPEVAYPLPEGWLPLPGAARLGDVPVADPEIRLDRDGSAWMFWTLEGFREPLRVTLEPEGAVRSAELVSLPPLRSDEERAQDGGASFISGPGVAFIAPVDGAVLGSDRLYVGALGEPGARTTLFSGDSILSESMIRGDGQVDFIGVGLERGTNRLRVRMINSWGLERWDSLVVHVTSVPASFAPVADTIALPADGVTIKETRVRVLDAWGVPVVNRPFVTVSTGQAEVVNADEDASSVGRQLLPGPDGWLTIRIRAASEISVDVLTLQAADAAGEVALQHIPKARELMITSMGQYGFGAAADDFGAVTVRGRLGAETAVTLAYDSRTLDEGRDAYGRTISPLDDAQYPILGDASVRRSEASSRPGLSARIERGTDWVAAGELAGMGFGTGLTLAQYRRALDGVAASVSTGPVTWSGFGALTSQSLRQVQIRGAGVSGPYDVGTGIVPGTERVVVETRDLDNPERSLQLQTLERLADYQIDYVTGTLLLKSPVPSVDLNNNPVFIVVAFESDGGGESTSVWGLRAETDFGIPLGLTVVQDRAEGQSFEMLGADLRVRARNGSELGAEVAYAENPDSAGLAVLTSGQANLLGGAVALTGQWMHVADGFINPSNAGLQAVDEIQVGAHLRVAGSALQVGHGR